MKTVYQVATTNSNDSTLFYGPVDKIDTFSHLFLPNLLRISCSLTCKRNQDWVALQGCWEIMGYIMWFMAQLFKKAAVEAQKYLSRKLASIEYMLALLKNQSHPYWKNMLVSLRMEASSGFMKKQWVQNMMKRMRWTFKLLLIFHLKLEPRTKSMNGQQPFFISRKEEQRRKKCILICGPLEWDVKRLHKQEEALKHIFLEKAGCARKGGGFIKSTLHHVVSRWWWWFSFLTFKF